MKIALFGYGKMGREVEAVAVALGHTIVQRMELDAPTSAQELHISGAECAIDFSAADAVERNVGLCAEAGMPIVIGTTGWDARETLVRKKIEEAGIGCVAGSNFSIGVNLFLAIVRESARLLDPAGYDAYILEAHHRAKKDVPSGTALRLSEVIIASMKSKTTVTTVSPTGVAIARDALLISSIRAGSITGTHTAGFESEDDSIELTHRARTRRGFAAGAIKAAEWIVGKKGFYRFEQNLDKILESSM